MAQLKVTRSSPYHRGAKYRIFTAACLLALWLLANIALPIKGQTSAPWETAEQIRRALFEAQKALLLDKTTEAQTQAQTAQDVFDKSLSALLAAQAPAVQTFVQSQLAAAQQAVANDDAVELALTRGQVWAGLLRGSYQITLQAAAENRPDVARPWLLLRDYRESTRFSRPGADATMAIEALKNGALSPPEAAARLKADLLDTYQARLNQELEAIEQAAQQNFAMRQAESVGLVYGYWLILQPAYEEQVGAPARQQADKAFDELLALAHSQEPARLNPALAEIRNLLRHFRAAPLSAEEQARRASQLLRFLSLVAVEYGRGVHEGQIILDFEIQEASTFLNGAKAAFEDLRLPLEGRDPAKTAEFERLLQQLDRAVQAANRKEQVEHEDTIAANVATVLGLLAEVTPAEWQQTNADADFDVLASVLDQVQAAVAGGQYDMAESARLEAYAIFDFGPEPRLLAFAPDKVARIDGLFWHGYDQRIGLAEAIASKASAEDIKATRLALDEALAEAQQILGDGPTAPAAVIGNAAVIVFREGLEAVVIMAALLASLVGAYEAYRRPMILGAMLAFIATLATGWLAQHILLSFSRFGERLEAVVSLIAIAVLLLITNWFFHKVYWTEWLGRFHKQKSRLLGGAAGQFLGLAVLGFSSVYREGFETVLFLQALILDAGPWIVLQGVALGLAGVAIVGVFTFKLQKRLPYKKMLVWTGILIGAVLLIMVGNTVHVLQAVGWMTITPVHGLTLPYWLGLWFGLFPTWESFGFQLTAAVFVIGSYYLAEYQHHRERALRTAKRAEVTSQIVE
ncbi:MAG: FTR1 family protein [Anaerolineae bacterium]|nr:FTR1 family protein [Anaerolineae bacterium]